MSRLLSRLFGKGDAEQAERAESGRKGGTVRASDAASAGEAAGVAGAARGASAPIDAASAAPTGARSATDGAPADQRLIAVITAAVAAFEEDSAFRIASIQPVRNFAAGGTPGFNTPVWGRVDRLSQLPFQR